MVPGSAQPVNMTEVMQAISILKEAGKFAEPVKLVETADGTLILVDGPSKYLAARVLGVPVAAEIYAYPKAAPNPNTPPGWPPLPPLLLQTLPNLNAALSQAGLPTIPTSWLGITTTVIR